MTLSEDGTITSKGQVTIPKRIRDALDLHPGEEVEFVVSEAGDLTLRQKRDPMDRLRDVRERLAPLEVDVDELRRESRTDWESTGGDE